MFRLVVLIVALLAAYANAGAVTSFDGAYVKESLKATVSPGDITFWFIPATAVAATDKVTITSDTAVFASDATNIVSVITSDGSSVTHTQTATSGGAKKIITVTVGAELKAGKIATITYPKTSCAVNVGAADVKYKIQTSTDTTPTTDATMYSTQAASKPLTTAVSGTRQTLKATVNGGDLTVKFKPTTAIAAAGTIKITTDDKIWTADDAGGSSTSCTMCQALVDAGKAKCKAVSVTKTVISGGAGKIATITLGGAVIPGTQVVITCDGSKNMAVNLAVDQATTFDIETSTDTTATGAQTGYTVKAGVTWTSATRSTSLVTGATGGNLVFTFTPTTAVAATGKVTLTASEGIFTADAAVTCTATSDGSDATVTSAASTSTAADTYYCTDCVAKKNILKVTMGAELAATKSAVITCTTNLAANGATAQAVTFDIETSTDIGKLGKQTGYTLTAPASSSSTSNTTAAASSTSSATGASTTATVDITFSGYTMATATDTNFMNVVKCGYANAVATEASKGKWCTAASGPSYTWTTGVEGTCKLANARRGGTKATTTLKVYSSVLASSSFKTHAASADKAKITTAIKAANTAAGAGFNASAMDVSALSIITWSSSDASAVVPSMMAGVVALFLSLMH